MDSHELVEVLRRDKAEFERIRARDPRATIDLSGADLSGCDLAKASLAGLNMRNACLRNADCSGANLRFTDLSGADLRGAKLDGANMHQTILEGANLDGASLGGINRETRFCLHAQSFRRTHWSKAELETMLRIMNENASWEIRYQIIPKDSAPSA
jgi:uncharacterized protein YjbI with pentapeptide repeats